MTIPEDSLDYATEWQKSLVSYAYGLNTFARETLRSMDDLIRPMPAETSSLVKTEQRTQQVVSALFSLVLSMPLFCLSSPCYIGAVCLGKGRFDKVEPAEAPKPLKKESIRIMSWNACLQDPYCTMTGGVTPPLDPIAGCANRVEAIVKAIPDKVDIFFGQEFESLAAQEEAIEKLKGRGFPHFRFDTGANSLINNSGLFIASKLPFEEVQFVSYPLKDRAGIAMGSQQGALACIITVAGQRLRLINTHMNYGNRDSEQRARERQLDHVEPLLQGAVPVLLGDFNCDIGEIMRTKQAFEGFVNAFEGDVTCTDQGKHDMRGKLKPSEGCPECVRSIDGIVFREDQVDVSEKELIWRPELSDHKAVLLTLKPIVAKSASERS